jgi:hypothetical protein
VDVYGTSPLESNEDVYRRFMWTFNSSTGDLFAPDLTKVERGYAGGNLGKNPEGINNKAYQYTKFIGPLPVGWYTFGTAVEGSHLGPLAIPLTPDAENDMRGRGDFYLHADTIGHPRCASEGCIVMSHTTRLLVNQSDDKRLQVI